MKPNFKDINIKAAAAQKDLGDWAAKNNIKKDWITPEQIPVKPVYTKEDLEAPSKKTDGGRRSAPSAPSF